MQEAIDFDPPVLELIPEPVTSIPITAATNRPTDEDEMEVQSIDDIAEPNRAVLEGIPFDPDLPTGPEELDSVTKSREPAMMHADEDPLEAILEEALYDDSGKSVESDFAHMPEETASDEPNMEEPAEHVAETNEAWDPLTLHDESAHVHDDLADFNDEPVQLHDESAHDADEAKHFQAKPVHSGTTYAEHAEPFAAIDDEDGARPRKKQRSFVFELAKILVGGVVGLAVGYAVLLWGFKIDPLGLAKMLPASVLPERLKATSAIANRPMQNTEVAQNVPPDAMPQPDAEPPTATNPAETATPDAAASQPNVDTQPTTPANGNEAASAVPSTQPQTMPADSTNPAATVPAPDSSMNNVPPPAAAQSTTTPPAISTVPVTDPFAIPANTPDAFPPLPAAVTPPMPEPEGPKSTKTFTLADVTKAMTAAATSSTELNSAAPGAPELKDLRKNYYLNLAKLAESITLLKPQADEDHDQTSRSAAAALVSNIAADKAKLDELGFLAGYWLDSRNRIQDGIDGIALAGTVQAIEPVGKQFRTFVKLLKGSNPAAKDAIVPVISTDKPNLAVGDIAVVLGTIVQNPAENLYHFAGNDERAVWGAVILKAPQSP